ncbi:MAG: ATP-binding cassette domain-containing protein [Lachnospiraceae bacterium]|nr:ATP-binding cassette domain-containing protein [Lachnospiraceae bacterium]
MIEVKNLTKEFKKPVRKQGVWGMITTLFSKEYETKVAVNDVSFTIHDGEIVGYIGSNGAGKSTTIKMMCGILNPTSGEVRIDGKMPYKKRMQVAEKIGVVFGQKTQLWWDIPLIESFKVLKEIYRVSDEEYEERMEFLCETLDLKEFLNQPVRTLSLGQRMRADLAASWLHNPNILFLDEPTIGLDVWVKEKIRQTIKTMNEKYNTTVILTTHDMQDIENLCSRIIMIEEGKVIYDGSLDNIKHRFGNIRTVEFMLKNRPKMEMLDTFGGKATYEWQEEKLYIKFDADLLELETVVKYAFGTLKAVDMQISEINIEDVVKDIMASKAKGEVA